MAQIIQTELATLGITVTIDAEEPAVYNTKALDKTAYDLIINAGAGGDFAVSPWLLAYDQGMNGGTTGDFFKDDQLQALLAKAASVDGFTPENLDAFNEYQKDALYDYGLLSFMNNIVSVKWVTTIVRDARGQIQPGACVFAQH
jgi:ABC-type transport system substrate-binding protein